MGRYFSNRNNRKVFNYNNRQTETGYLVEWKALIADIELEEVDFMEDYVSQFKYLIETDS
ncbi:MAG: hypothetical protein K9G67_13245 [Bacteroidales bacterium]|nr:hypothetical protein [Bacteroidales bacterium]MCF8344739.1 hypothetical protein [Bacteroidales bacterium]MCF8352096.1 hypothetical protein [Bacteroidales bacterium]MCF8377316.1 hypothetical protein [Bacteroidales bacterium]